MPAATAATTGTSRSNSRSNSNPPAAVANRKRRKADESQDGDRNRVVKHALIQPNAKGGSSSLVQQGKGVEPSLPAKKMPRNGSKAMKVQQYTTSSLIATSA